MTTAYADSVVDFDWPDGPAGDRVAALVRAMAACGARAMRALDRSSGRLYLPASIAADDDARDAVRALPGAFAQAIEVTRELPGASAGGPVAFHYVVETDVEPSAEREFNAWYDEEHLAGLASVPGTVRAVRYLRPGAAPRYGACYDLAAREVYGSPAWLAVRATPWSSRVRPAFRNTTRTMYRLRPPDGC